MKSKFLFLYISVFFISTRCGYVNTTDIQTSKDIKDSKSNDFFIQEYQLLGSTDENIILEEAWVEKTWCYESENFKTRKVPKERCQLCFKLKQTNGLIYKND